MDCPHCKVKMFQAIRMGEEIDYCPQCGGIWLDYGEIDRINEALLKLSETDELTSLDNRRSFKKKAYNQMHAAIEDKFSFAIAMIDIDYFKQINDKFGHLAGDLVLQNLSDHLLKLLRSDDIVARYGGEEFILFIPKIDERGALLITENLRKAIKEITVHFEDQPIQFTISIGLTIAHPDSQMRLYDFINEADMALYEAKHTGRNKVVSYSALENKIKE